MSGRFAPSRLAGAALGWLLGLRHSAALRESEARFRSLTELSNDFFWETDAEHRYTAIELGPAYIGVRNNLSKLGLARWEIACTSPDEAAWAAHRAVIAARKRFVDFRFSRIEDGEERFYEHSGEPRYDASGRFLGYRGVGRDVTPRKHAEDALRESEKRYERVMLASDAGIWDWDLTTDRYYVSPRFLELCGIPPGTTFSRREDFIRHRPIHPEDREKWEQAVKALFASRDTRVAMEVRSIVHGEPRWRRLEGVCFRDATGRVVRWTGTSTDITERKRAEEALRESEERHARAIKASNAGLWEWDVRKDEYYCSPRHLELLGFAPGTTFAGRADFVRRAPFHPEDLERWQQEQRQLFATGGSYLVMDVRVIGSGEMRWVRVNAFCFRDGAGTIARWTGSVTDVTEGKRAEEALRRSEERYSLAMGASEEGHFDLNLDTGEMFISERLNEIYGFPPGTRFANRSEYLARVRLHADDAEKYHAALAAALANDGPERYEFEFRILLASGDVRWLRTRGKVTRDAEGRARRRTGVVADVTARKLAELGLSTSVGRYALAMEAAGDGHTDWDLQTGEHYISPRLLQICGYAPGTTFRDRAEWVRRFPFHPEDRPKWERAVAAHFAGRDSHFKMELRIVVRGEVRWTVFHFLSTRDAAGAPIRWSGSIGDITEQKRTEEALRLSESRYAVALEDGRGGPLGLERADRRDLCLRTGAAGDGRAARGGVPNPRRHHVARALSP